MTYHSMIAWIIIAATSLTLPAWAVEYRLQVTHLDFRVFSSYLEPSSAHPAGQETMSRLETLLDHMEFTTAAVIPGREVQVLEDPRYGGAPPARQSVLPATRDQAWTTFIWEGTPGQRIAVQVKSYMAGWQEVWALAANPQGILRRLSIGGPGMFGQQSREVPIVPQDFIANAADQGTFVSWLQARAKNVGGMLFAIARRNEVFTSADRVYMLLTLPPEPYTFKVVVAWKDHDDRSRDGRGFDRLRWSPGENMR
jgi:hypothetical protein